MRQSDRRDELRDWSAVPSPEAVPSEHAEANELAERLRRAIGQLPRRQAAVFCLRCLEELSYEEIGRQLGISANAAGVALKKARVRLRQLLEPASCDPART